MANSHLRDGKEEYYLSQFEQQRVRGVLVTPSGADLDQHRATAHRGTPVVLVDSVDPEEGFCTIVVDDHYGGYLAVDHLIGLGRTRILVVGGPPHFRQVGRRHAGALAAAEGRGVELAYLEAPDMTILAGRAIGEQILRTMSPIPDAIFAMNDLLATGLLQALVMNRGVRVPENIALIGYDDIDFCANAIVPISSVRQPSAELGRRAVELLEAEIDDGRTHEHVSVVLKPVLVVRQSTAGTAATQG
ncbi:hypothetical protein BW733_03830 [Tessaracoccus flavescens]|uniref:Transcriptional regulator LacI/GalR-like sensor domain-containing protein n=1 Tax=Tessaracoccus flavescens TaxID=399497 RepID=A0A1Q2CVE9_9ACTN|nr:hypothetical protein BW733_03830 [Tessaracoccus flavescens]